YAIVLYENKTQLLINLKTTSMNNKFKNLSVDADTEILANFKSNVGDYEVLYQKWCWDGIYAESIIFFNEDVADLNEEQIKNQVKENTALLKENSQMTFKKGELYTFVNFNFVYS